MFPPVGEEIQDKSDCSTQQAERAGIENRFSLQLVEVEDKGEDQSEEKEQERRETVLMPDSSLQAKVLFETWKVHPPLFFYKKDCSVLAHSHNPHPHSHSG